MLPVAHQAGDDTDLLAEPLWGLLATAPLRAQRHHREHHHARATQGWAAGS
jgi:hypothetical protein